jgi:hypothetical protein
MGSILWCTSWAAQVRSPSAQVKAAAVQVRKLNGTDEHEIRFRLSWKLHLILQGSNSALPFILFSMISLSIEHVSFEINLRHIKKIIDEQISFPGHLEENYDRN